MSTPRNQHVSFDLEHLRSFRAVARIGSFTRAAAELGYHQATVTHHIKTLERKLRTSLLDRTRFSKSATLTEAGRKVLDSSERILALVDETSRLLNQGYPSENTDSIYRSSAE